MANLRSFFRRDVTSEKSIRVLAAGGTELLGNVLDINQKGFRLAGGKGFKPGDMLNGLIEFAPDGGIPQHVQVKAQCAWANGKEFGFSIREVPLSAEAALDKVIAFAHKLP